MTMPAKDNAIPSHCDQMEVVARHKPARAQHHEERRECRERAPPGSPWCKGGRDRSAGTRGANSTPAIIPASKRAVAFEQGNAAKLRPGEDQDRGDRRADDALDQRRDIMDRELDRNLIESPDQAKRDSECDRERIKRAGLGGMLHEFSSISTHRHCAQCRLRQRPPAERKASPHRSRQCAHTPVISITGRLGREAGRSRGGLERFRNVAAGRLADRAAALADEEHDEIVAVVIVHAGDEGIAALDAVHEAVVRAENRARDRP